MSTPKMEASPKTKEMIQNSIIIGILTGIRLQRAAGSDKACR